MYFSADLLHTAISGLALPGVETANCVDLGQMIWGIVGSGQTRMSVIGIQNPNKTDLMSFRGDLRGT